MSLLEENLDRFRAAFAIEIAARADRESLAGVIQTDGPLNADELCVNTARVLRGAGPWGQGFPEPLFDGEFRILDARIVGDKHLKMQLRDADAPTGNPGSTDPDRIEAIAFGYVGGAAEDPEVRSGARIRLAYRLEVNDYRGVERVQLNCQHFKLA
jgi:single-stranded-DNA-specific exonuclease